MVNKMDQYQNSEEPKPRIKLPLVKQDVDARVNDLERMYIRQQIVIEKLQRKIGRLENDIETLSRRQI